MPDDSIIDQVVELQRERDRRRFSASAKDDTPWPELDLAIVEEDDKSAPPFDDSVLSRALLDWARRTAADCSAPVDYIVGNLIGCASAAIGNARRVSP